MLPEPIPAKNDSDRIAICAGCGASSSLRVGGCPVCGKSLAEDFYPLDSIRSSYNLQGRALQFPKSAFPEGLFPRDGNAISDTAWACTVYSMVPYLGILFVPAAILIGGFGYVAARRTHDFRVARTALIAVGVSIGLTVIQLVFWWLLYLIPEIGL